jgi:hypothetical protein
MDKSLKLSEKLFCLAIDPKSGGILLGASSALCMTLTGSVFVELMKKGLISIDRKIVQVIDPTVQADEIHEFFLNRIRQREKSRRIRNWLSYFDVRNRKIQKLFIRSLVRKNVLRTEEKRILFIPYEKVYIMDKELVENIRREVEVTLMSLSGSMEDSIVLSVMVAKTNLLSRIFSDRARRKEAAKNLKQLPESDISKEIQEAIQMMHAAVFASIS